MNMYFRQKIAAILPWAIAASLVLAPAPMLLMLALYRFAQKHPDWQKVYQYLMIYLNVPISLMTLTVRCRISKILSMNIKSREFPTL